MSMKLFVIVICLLSERFLVHKLSLYRFHWFPAYYQTIINKFPKVSSWLLLLILIVPLLLITGIILYFLGPWIYGIVGLLINLLLVYYCLGPQNPFYPAYSGEPDREVQEVGDYLVQANNQLFAIIFWYIVLGPLCILAYRLISLCKEQELTRAAALKVLSVFDWIPVRITALLYLLAGNFQLGFRSYYQQLLSTPEDNTALLKTCGMRALATNEDGTSSASITMLQAERLVEHSVIILLLLTAFYTLASSR
jgi:AmpE protein